MSEQGSLPASVQAFTRLLRAHAAVTRQLSSELQASHALTINDYEALYLLSVTDGQRLRRVDLAQQLLLTPSGITRLLEGLEEAGLVERQTCADDLRVTYAALTDAGAEKLRCASCGHVGSIRTLFEEHLSRDELERLADLLGRLPGVDGGSGCC